MSQIEVKALRRLLEQLPDDFMLTAQTRAQTGNLAILTPEGVAAGYIDIDEEAIYGSWGGIQHHNEKE